MHSPWARKRGALANALPLGKFSNVAMAATPNRSLRTARFPGRRDASARKSVFTAFARVKHARKDEADPAKRTRRVALQRFLDARIFLEHLWRHRSAGLTECDVEIRHR